MSTSKKQCPHFLQGKCRFGDKCRLAHTKDVNRSPSIATFSLSRRACTFYKQGRCNQGSSCPFLHDGKPEDVLVAPTFGPCAFFLKGKCTKGDTCPFPHPQGVNPVCPHYLAGKCRFGSQCSSKHSEDASSAVLPPPREFRPIAIRQAAPHVLVPIKKAVPPNSSITTPKQVDDVVPATKESALERHERQFYHCKVFFGPGAQIEEIITAFDSRIVVVSNVVEEDTQATLIEAFSPFGDLENITLLKDNDTAMARVTYATVGQAAAAVRGLRNSHYAPKMDSKVVESGQAVLRSTKVKISWFTPRRIGWAHYSSISTAQTHAARLDGASFNGNILKATFQTPTFRQRKSFSVELKGLPSSADEYHLIRFCQCQSVTLKKAGYDRTTSLLDVESQLREIGPLDTFEALPEDKKKSKVIAFAHFAQPEHASKAVAVLHNSTQSYLNRAPMWLEHIHGVKYNVKPRLFSAIKDAVDGLKTESGECKLRYYEPSVDDGTGNALVCIRLFSPNPVSLGVTKRRLEVVLEGTKIIDDEAQPVWDQFFATEAGARFLGEAGESRGIYVECDERNRVLHVYGNPDDVTRTRAAILEQLQILKVDERSIALDRRLLSELMRGGMDKLSSRFGQASIVVNIVRKTMKVEGDVDVDEVRLALHGLGSTQQNESAQSCPVCYCDATKPVTLRCGLTYCKECLSHMLSSTSTTSPFAKCIHEGTDSTLCNAGVAISTIRELLLPTEEHALFKTAFLSHIHAKAIEFKYCPTPDCNVVYRAGEEGTVLTCPSCLNRICVACHVQFHEGLSCRDLRENIDEKFIEWKKRNGVKECPTCGASIEKIEGCNHMTCSRCQTHMCWVCLETFPGNRLDREGGVYEHLRRKHNGMY